MEIQMGKTAYLYHIFLMHHFVQVQGLAMNTDG